MDKENGILISLNVNVERDTGIIKHGMCGTRRKMGPL